MAKYYYLDGSVLDHYNENRVLHRIDGPAVKRSNSDYQWRKNGELHRLDGPAAKRSNGDYQWRKNGELHRLDGPALRLFGREYWFIDGKELNKKQFEKHILIMKLSGLLNG